MVLGKYNFVWYGVSARYKAMVDGCIGVHLKHL